MVNPKRRSPLKVDFQTTTNWSEDDLVGGVGQGNFSGIPARKAAPGYPKPKPREWNQ